MKRFLLALAICSSFAFAQDIPRARQLAQQLIEALAAPVIITTADQFDAARATAAPGSTIRLATSFRYDKPLTLDSSIELRADVGFVAGTQVTLTEAMPSFTAGLTVTGPNVTLVGIEVRQTVPTANILNMAGANTTLDRVRVLGDPVLGAKRGINYTGSNGIITNCVVDDIFQPAQDTQAIYSDNMGEGTFFVDNCFLRAAGEVVMFGGGDAAPGRDPHDVTMNNTVLDKKAEWLVFDRPDHHTEQTKCSLELKNINGFQSKGCTFRRGGGISAGQGGYAFDFTVRNQSGNNPTASVQNVVIEDFLVEQPGSGIATLLGSDNNFVSGPLKNLTLRRGTVTGVDHNALSATHTTGRLFAFDRAPQQVTLQDIMVKGVGIRSICYFSGKVPPTGLVLGNITVDNGGVAIPYRYKLDGGTAPAGISWPTGIVAALRAYMPDVVLDATVF